MGADVHPQRRRVSGAAALETLLAVPLVLLASLLALQFALVLNARQAVVHAAIEGARTGAVNHADPRAIERGFARGITPWLIGSQGALDHEQAVWRAGMHLYGGMLDGWVRWRQLSPTEASFQDWAVPVLDDAGLPIPGSREIPADHLDARRWLAGGGAEAGALPGEGPVGAASGQTLSEANLLKLEFTYGVALVVPLAGRLAAWAMARIEGCPAAAAAAAAGAGAGQVGASRLGALALGAPPPVIAPWVRHCAFYNAVDAAGRPRPRWPVRVSAVMRMQQAARHAGAG
ncbi:MAG: pilus assembly protein [Betaproteobacteria bacterium]|nr:pilus assembly protein [Betaproteobacteria bacterium]